MRPLPRFLSLVLLIAMIVSLGGCAGFGKADLMATPSQQGDTAAQVLGVLPAALVNANNKLAADTLLLQQTPGDLVLQQRVTQDTATRDGIAKAITMLPAAIASANAAATTQPAGTPLDKGLKAGADIAVATGTPIGELIGGGFGIAMAALAVWKGFQKSGVSTSLAGVLTAIQTGSQQGHIDISADAAPLLSSVKLPDGSTLLELLTNGGHVNDPTIVTAKAAA